MDQNKSESYYEIVRNLYNYRLQAKNILRSRTYLLANTTKTVLKQPLVFGKKTVVMAVKDPKRLTDIITGKRAIQNNKQITENLKTEYKQWVDATKMSKSDISNQINLAKQLKLKPLVSLITPVFNPPVDAHKKLIDSVLGQTYQNFELLLYDFGDNSDVYELLDTYAKLDSRIKVKHGMPNEGIGANSNLCLKDVKGDFLALLDHDDALTPDALYECINALNQQDTDFIYTDKDKITEDDVRFDPLFKPDWSPEMALGGNYMTHFNLMRTKKVKELGGWDHSTDGAQDWDLFLRLVAVSNKQPVHVPRIVYHWRTVKTSTSVSNKAKPYVVQAQQKAVNKYLDSLGVTKHTVEHDIHGQLNVHWKSSSIPAVFIQSVFHDIGLVSDLVKNLLLQEKSIQINVFIQKDKMTKKERQALEAYPEIKIIEYEQGNYVSVVTKEAAMLHQENIIHIVDSIKTISSLSQNKSWIDQLAGWLSLPGVSIAGVGIYAESGQIADIGSYYDPISERFSKYYFGAGLKSNYNGHTQWIRNHLLVSENLFIADAGLYKEMSHIKGLRDDELPKALALIANSKGYRCVYDPLIYAVDNAPFELRLKGSDSLSNFMNNNCIEITIKDPYYNSNLDTNYTNPSPCQTAGNTKVNKGDSVVLRTVDVSV